MTQSTHRKSAARTDHPDPLFVSHADCLKILTIEETMRICEDVFRMHARGTVSPPIPPAFKLDDGEFSNHWHVKGVLLEGNSDHRRAPLRLLRRWRDQHGWPT